MNDANNEQPESKKPLTDQQRWNNVCDALAQDALKDANPAPISEESQKRIWSKVQSAAGHTDRAAAEKNAGRKAEIS